MGKIQSVSPLFTDLYEITMAAGYFENSMLAEATFSVFVRTGDRERGYFVSAGLENVLDILSSYAFSEPDIEYLQSTGKFSQAFLSFLANLRFTGDVLAMPEGTVFYPEEPLLEISAPIIEAQLIETVVLNTLGFQTMIATKAARCMHSAQGRPLIDFSLRRTHAYDAGMKVASSTWIAGFAGTSNVLAGQQLGISVSGTMAHSFVSAFNSELDAFMAYAGVFPDSTVLLIDTYDLAEGAKNAVKVAGYLREKGYALQGVRLDSGDMVAGSREVREILDREGFPEVKIFASSGFDEYKIAEILEEGAMIDAFGVGTKVGVSADAPFLDIVYKLVKFDDRNVKKLSPGKITLAGQKQVFRKSGADGSPVEDILGTRDENLEDTAQLLVPVMKAGRLLKPHPSLRDIRSRLMRNVSALGNRYKALDQPADYPVKVSDRLSLLQRDRSPTRG
jgi:nicotinate phosphoribosyltransferase